MARTKLERRVYLLTWGSCATLIEATSEETARTAWARSRSARFKRQGVNPKDHGVDLHVREADGAMVRAFHEARTARMDKRIDDADEDW